MDTLSDADKSVCQSAGVALILWLRGGVVAEHSLNVETQYETEETACLTVLTETRRGKTHSCLEILTTPQGGGILKQDPLKNGT